MRETFEVATEMNFYHIRVQHRYSNMKIDIDLMDAYVHSFVASFLAETLLRFFAYIEGAIRLFWIRLFWMLSECLFVERLLHFSLCHFQQMTTPTVQFCSFCAFSSSVVRLSLYHDVCVYASFSSFSGERNWKNIHHQN